MRKLLVLMLILCLPALPVSAKWFQKKTIFSQALQQEKTYYVGLPQGYDESDTLTKYPVIIFLHGASVTATDMVNSIEPLLDNFFTRMFFDRLFKVIFIIPDGSCEPYKGSFYTNSVLYGNYEDYIVQDITEEVSEKYHTFKVREKWSIMGHSMGGFGAMKIALKYPEKFIGVSSLSGPLNVTYFDDILPVIKSEHGTSAPYKFDYSGNVTKLVYSMAGAFTPNLDADPAIDFPVDFSGNLKPDVLNRWENYNPINLIRDWNGEPAMAIHTYCGEKDEFKLAVPNQMFADTLEKYHLAHTYKQDPSGDHVNSLVTSFPQGINFLYQVMDTAQIKIPTNINQFNLAERWIIYPNPSSDRFFISGATEKISQITIYNFSGQKVLMIENPEQNNGFDISQLISGVYFVLIKNSLGNTTTLKLIKNKS
ncbi:MAG: alpha/beta hydrolase-fold protein [Prolixibacteraceae bacterium]